MNTMLRKRINDPGVEAEYAGPDIIDLKEAEWIEFTDSDHRLMRLGIDKYSHLPLRWVVVTRNPETREQTEVITSYTQYALQDGLKLRSASNFRAMTAKFPRRFYPAANTTPISLRNFLRAPRSSRPPKIQGKKGLKEPKN